MHRIGFIMKEALSLSLSLSLSVCPFCVDMTENESHVLFVCRVYCQLREKFPLPVVRDVSMTERYCRLYNDPDDKRLLNMSRFIFFVLKLRECNE